MLISQLINGKEEKISTILIGMLVAGNHPGMIIKRIEKEKNGVLKHIWREMSIEYNSPKLLLLMFQVFHDNCIKKNEL